MVSCSACLGSCSRRSWCRLRPVALAEWGTAFVAPTWYPRILRNSELQPAKQGQPAGARQRNLDGRWHFGCLAECSDTQQVWIKKWQVNWKMSSALLVFVSESNVRIKKTSLYPGLCLRHTRLQWRPCGHLRSARACTACYRKNPGVVLVWN